MSYNNTSSFFSFLPNYSYISTHCLYNLLLSILKISNLEQQKEIIESIKVNLGMSWYYDFKHYCLRKLSVAHPVVQILHDVNS